MASKNIFYWGTGSFSGTGQFNEGPFNIGTVTTLLRARVVGAINYQGVILSDTSVFANLLLWGLSWVDHGASPLDIVTSTDNDQFLVREQTKQGAFVSWAPNTDDGAVLASLELTADWSGQLAIGATNIDAYMSLQPPFGGSTGNFNTYGTVEFWYT